MVDLAIEKMDIMWYNVYAKYQKIEKGEKKNEKNTFNHLGYIYVARYDTYYGRKCSCRRRGVIF